MLAKIVLLFFLILVGVALYPQIQKATNNIEDGSTEIISIIPIFFILAMVSVAVSIIINFKDSKYDYEFDTEGSEEEDEEETEDVRKKEVAKPIQLAISKVKLNERDLIRSEFD